MILNKHKIISLKIRSERVKELIDNLNESVDKEMDVLWEDFNENNERKQESLWNINAVH